MARGGARPGAGRPKSSRAVKEPAKKEARKQARDDAQDSGFMTGGKVLSPLEYMLAVMNSDEVDDGRRDRMAVAAAPFVHTKMGEGGKKEQKAEAAKEVASRFGRSTPPKLATAGGKKV